MTCEDCLYKLVCEDYQHSGCCDADNCVDFKSFTSVISVKRNIGDLLYEPEKSHVAIYKVTAVHIVSTGIYYEVETVRSAYSRTDRTSVYDAEIGITIFVTYHEAERRVRRSSICFECAHAAVCKDPTDFKVCCDHYLALDISSVKLSHTFPYAVGDTVYVIRDGACTTGAGSRCVVPYTINEISILKHPGHTVESITLNSVESSDDYIRVDGLDRFLELFGRVFFNTQKDAECACDGQ